MENMPKMVAARLARKAPEPSAHPDANLLAAFAERTLLERERAAVIAHLVECADCRECVAWACATAEPEMPVAAGQSAGPGLGGWLRQWRWIVSSTAACCVVATALLHYSQPPAREVSEGVLSNAGGPQIVDALKNQPPAPVPLTLARKNSVEARRSKKTQLPVLMAAKKDVALQDVLTQPQPPAETALTVPHSEPSRADAVSSLAETERAASVPRAPAPSPNAAKRFSGQAALAGRAQGFVTQLRAGEPAKLSLRPVATSARLLWSINASPDTSGRSRGIVQRSMDGGQSWQAVPLSERTSFRAVAAVGPDVWAGGSEGTLFHSPDGGAHWEERKIAGENTSISGDIVKIDARDPNQVTVTAASGEVWTSLDNGRHWVRE